MIRSYAERSGFIYPDFYSTMANDRNGLKDAYTYDGVHPNEAGYKIMEPLTEEAVSMALKNKVQRENNT
jgi:lysophospholipase L1-like esterase